MCKRHARMRDVLQLFGREHLGWGELDVAEQAGGRTAGAICVGADGPDGVRIFKADLPVPNEDACGAIDDDDATLLVVADGHRGHRSSHLLVEGVLQQPVPRDPLGLLSMLRELIRVDLERDASASTLLLAVWSRARGRGFGVSYGDSTMAVLSRSKPPVIATRKNDRYVSPWHPHTLDPMRALEFEFSIPDDGVAVAFTDGIDECCYGAPERSLDVGHLWGLLEESGGAVDSGSYARDLANAALRGVGGNPGGQDNLAIVATRP